MDCIFCKIANHELDSEFLYEDDQVFVIKDIHPKAKVHVLAIPKQHLQSFNDLTVDNSAVVSQLALAAQAVVKKLGIDESGYKMVVNNGPDGGQVVPHLHLHILGGERVKGVT